MCVRVYGGKNIASKQRATVWHMLQRHNNNNNNDRNSLGNVCQQKQLTVVYLFLFSICCFWFCSCPNAADKTFACNALRKRTMQNSGTEITTTTKSALQTKLCKKCRKFRHKMPWRRVAEWSVLTRGETKALRWHKNSPFPLDTLAIFRKLFVEQKENIK